MVLGPIRLCLLLHHIVPGIDFLSLELVENVIRCTGEIQEAGLLGIQLVNDLLGKVGLCSFVCFINDNKIPFRIEYIGILL